MKMSPRLTEFHPDHMRDFPGQPLLAESTGLTLWRGERALMCGGVAPCLWGPELWIYVQEDATVSERLVVGRIAKLYVREKLEELGELWAHARRGNERWLRWLGFGLDFIHCDTFGDEVFRRWRLREASWASQ